MIKALVEKLGSRWNRYKNGPRYRVLKKTVSVMMPDGKMSETTRYYVQTFDLIIGWINDREQFCGYDGMYTTDVVRQTEEEARAYIEYAVLPKEEKLKITNTVASEYYKDGSKVSDETADSPASAE